MKSFTQPTNLSIVVGQNPPPEIATIGNGFEHSIKVKHLVFAAARYLCDNYEYSLLQDRFGQVWVQKDAHMIVPNGARRIIVKTTQIKPPDDWLKLIQIKVHSRCNTKKYPRAPYAIGVLALYENVDPGHLQRSSIPLYLLDAPYRSRLVLKPVNAWMVFRSKLILAVA